MLPLVARRGGWAKVTKLRHATRLHKRQSLKYLAPLPPPPPGLPWCTHPNLCGSIRLYGSLARRTQLLDYLRFMYEESDVTAGLGGEKHAHIWGNTGPSIGQSPSSSPDTLF